MKFKISIFSLFFVLCFSLSVKAKMLDLNDFVLGNGLKVVVVQNKKAPVIMHELYYKVGSIDDPMFKGGLAHLLEHLMFRGTKNVKDKEFNYLTEINGADNNAYTTYSHTGYYEFSDISKLELMMALEADRMENLEINDEAFYKERDIVLEERMQRFETNPSTKFYETLNKVFWDKHVLARPVSGEIEEIKGLEKKDVLDFYNKYYKPSNAILVMVGDISVDEAKVLANKYYGKIKNNDEKINDIDVYKLKSDKANVEMAINGVTSPRFVSYWHLKKGEFSDKEILALNILSEFLTGDDTAYLYDKLVYQDKSFLSVGVEVSYDEKLGGKIGFYGVPAHVSMKLDDFKKIMSENIKVAMNNFEENKLQEIKNESLSNAIYMLENPQSIASFVGAMLIDGKSVEEIENYDEFIKSVSFDDVKAVWNKVINQEKREIYGMIKPN